MSDDSRAFVVRKKAYDLNLKMTIGMVALGYLTFVSVIVFSPLTEYQHSQKYEETNQILYYVLHVQGTFAHFITCSLTMGACFILYTIIFVLATEFDLCGLTFSNILYDKDSKTDENLEVKIDQFKNAIQAYQKLLG